MPDSLNPQWDAGYAAGYDKGFDDGYSDGVNEIMPAAQQALELLDSLDHSPRIAEAIAALKAVL